MCTVKNYLEHAALPIRRLAFQRISEESATDRPMKMNRGFVESASLVSGIRSSVQ